MIADSLTLLFNKHLLSTVI